MPTLEPNLNPVTGSGDAFVPFRQVSPEVARLQKNQQTISLKPSSLSRGSTDEIVEMQASRETNKETNRTTSKLINIVEAPNQIASPVHTVMHSDELERLLFLHKTLESLFFQMRIPEQIVQKYNLLKKATFEQIGLEFQESLA